MPPAPLGDAPAVPQGLWRQFRHSPEAHSVPHQVRDQHPRRRGPRGIACLAVSNAGLRPPADKLHATHGSLEDGIVQLFLNAVLVVLSSHQHMACRQPYLPLRGAAAAGSECQKDATTPVGHRWCPPAPTQPRDGHVWWRLRGQQEAAKAFGRTCRPTDQHSQQRRHALPGAAIAQVYLGSSSSLWWCCCS